MALLVRRMIATLDKAATLIEDWPLDSTGLAMKADAKRIDAVYDLILKTLEHLENNKEPVQAETSGEIRVVFTDPEGPTNAVP